MPRQYIRIHVSYLRHSCRNGCISYPSGSVFSGLHLQTVTGLQVHTFLDDHTPSVFNCFSLSSGPRSGSTYPTFGTVGDRVTISLNVWVLPTRIPTSWSVLPLDPTTCSCFTSGSNCVLVTCPSGPAPQLSGHISLSFSVDTLLLPWLKFPKADLWTTFQLNSTTHNFPS